MFFRLFSEGNMEGFGGFGALFGRDAVDYARLSNGDDVSFHFWGVRAGLAIPSPVTWG